MISEGENIKKIFIIVGIITLFAVAGFGVCGYLKAQEVKERGQAMGQIAAGTLNLETLKQDQTEISLLPWKNLSENSTRILKELETVIVAPDDLREKVGEFYSARAKDKYVEAQYLEVLIDVQRKLDL